MISLAVGRLEVDWGKNNAFADHSALFQPGDLTQIPYYYAGAEKSTGTGEPDWEVTIEMKDGLSKPLPQVVDRINNRYRKLVIDPQTGEKLRDVDEPLSDHQGYGSAKKRSAEQR